MRRLWLICYDVSDEKLRRRISNQLENAGFRRQYSVFEARLNQHQQTQLREQLASLIHGEDASIRWYPLCRWCREQAEYLGESDYFSESDKVEEGYFIV